ncbi:MAG: cell division protein SepF [Lachnospiraceae bacterium]
MRMFDRVLGMMHLNGEDDEYYDDEFYDEEEYEEEPPKKRFFSKQEEEHEEEVESDRPRKTSSKITPMRAGKKQVGAGMEVCVIRPKTMEDARDITETLLNNRTIVLNMEGLDMDMAQRIIDFASGSCYAVSGNLQKVSNYIFILTPSTVDISGDIQSIVDSLDTGIVTPNF